VVTITGPVYVRGMSPKHSSGTTVERIKAELAKEMRTKSAEIKAHARAGRILQKELAALKRAEDRLKHV
jgi:hypothetical protein